MEIKVASFKDIYGRNYVVIERNGIRFIQETTMGLTHAKETGVRQGLRDIKQDNGGRQLREDSP